MDIKKIDLEHFIDTCNKIKNEPITSKAPLGYSTNSILLHGENRKSEVSIRNHSGMFSMLITTQDGRFLFNGGASMKLTVETAAYILYMAFIMVKDQITE